MEQNAINLAMKNVRNVIEMENALLVKIIIIGILIVIIFVKIVQMVLVILKEYV